MQLGRELDLGDFITLPSLLGKEGKRKEVHTVNKPAGMKDVEDIEDQVGVSGHYRLHLGDARSNPAPSVVIYGGTRQREGKSRGGKSL